MEAAMSRYYFDSGRRGLVVDDEGRELSDVEAVQMEAARSLVDMARDCLLETTAVSVDQIAIQVRDDAGPVMKVRFKFEIDKTN